MFENVVKEVPDYKAFYKIDELNTSSEKLAHKHPGKVKIFEIGRSRKGERIKALRIGKGEKTALLLVFPIQTSLLGA